MTKSPTRHWADFVDHLDRDPGSRKWMVSCIACGRVGLRADTPERFWNRPNLEQLGRMRLDDLDLCQECRRAHDIAAAADSR